MASLSHKCALVLIDLQNDFMPGGPLAVPDGDAVIPIVNQLLELPYNLIVASQDCHPRDHGSFAATHGREIGEEIILDGLKQRLWPVHCVAGTAGADFVPGWHRQDVDVIIYKGKDINVDSYSAFFDNGYRFATPLEGVLRSRGIEVLFIAGVATDYCVKYSVLDACRLGFKVFVVTDACRGVNVHPHDVDNAYAEMVKAGASLISSLDVGRIIASR
jgi:nicotinamidase/pyrazinamidase